MNSQRYEVLDVIGAGGMATVWRARDLRLGRDVAIKRPNDGTDVAQFEHEARIAARVVHPNVVRVYDVDVDEVGPYLVMELIHGPSVAEARPGPEQAAQLGRAVASALAALHSEGIVHGDVKPANVLLADDGAKLTDFGVARRDGDAPTTTVFATPAYAAPEIAAGGTPTAAADVYSLAVVLHELVTGTSWSSAATTTQPMPAGDWAAVLGAALSTDPAMRPNAAELAASLGRLDQMPTAPPTVPLPPMVPHSPMPLGPTGPAVSAPVPPSTDAPSAVPTRGARAGRRRGLLTAAAIVGVIALVAAIAVLANRPGAQVSSGPTGPTVIPSAVAETTQTVVTTAPPDATSPAVPATTPPTPSTVVPSTPPTTAASEVARSLDELSQLVNAQPPNELKPKDTRDLIDRIERLAAQVDTDPEQAEQELLELSERLASQLDGEARDAARDLMVSLAEQIGVSSDDIEERFEHDDD